ncbi:GlxA family transcriptional regulator [Pseudoalteromonas aurantia]|uniref:AraC family transcriptional regulator n=1 Tax=Pseudoalteromonas aurantia TaxID=43654 RepID=A0A5S3V8Q5_9GAMM|nr:helix-turn-helix domain-containing protein [Pseudoalteromonas aurantia]TMO67775.1 AraC family transcriptional regulator [Pseudoalteromonas aurantia]TMO67813.1 AraC family transcriptional regulator [Pseudoalteromonas aurantia]TMO78182.1 AraC family transcriptional regulator [Pseudoalteromonas aurantia]
MKQEINIAFTLYEHMLFTSVTLPAEMLRAGEAYAKRHLGEKFIPLKLNWLAQHEQSVENNLGMQLSPNGDLTKLAQQDYVIMPSIWRNPRPVVRKNNDIAKQLVMTWQQGGTLIGVGTGVCFLAESGLLNTHPATTHWHYAKQFQRDYPQVVLKPDFFITQSERIYTVASLNALADVIVHLISQLYGPAAANHVQQNFSHEIRKPYEEQRYLEGAVDKHPDEQIAAIQFWMKHNFANEITLAEVAQQFDMSYRTFNRRFKAATGQTAADYLQVLRLESAKELLANSNLSLQDIAVSVGFSAQGLLTRIFKTRLQQTPSEYRKIVRKKLFS